MSLFIYHGTKLISEYLESILQCEEVTIFVKKRFFLSNGAFINDDIVAVAVKVKAKVLLQRIYMYMYQKLI